MDIQSEIWRSIANVWQPRYNNDPRQEVLSKATWSKARKVAYRW